MRLSPLALLLTFLIALCPSLAASSCRYSKGDFRSILNCAEKADIKAQKELGDRYLHGLGVAQSTTEAIRWYQQSAEGGSVEAQYLLGYLYQRGLGLRRSDSTALTWYRRAADNGHLEAQFNLATLLLTSSEFPKRPDEAARWYRAAADRGELAAANNLGYLYETGMGVGQNLEEARRYYQNSAQGNNREGQYNLARLLIDDARVQARNEGQQWLERSAKQGFVPAMALLGRFYAEKATPPNYSDAFYWFSLAAAFGDPAGKVGRAVVMPNLEGRDIEEIYRRLHDLPSFEKNARRPSRRRN